MNKHRTEFLLGTKTFELITSCIFLLFLLIEILCICVNKNIIASNKILQCIILIIVMSPSRIIRIFGFIETKIFCRNNILLYIKIVQTITLIDLTFCAFLDGFSIIISVGFSPNDIIFVLSVINGLFSICFFIAKIVCEIICLVFVQKYKKCIEKENYKKEQEKQQRLIIEKNQKIQFEERERIRCEKKEEAKHVQETLERRRAEIEAEEKERARIETERQAKLEEERRITEENKKREEIIEFYHKKLLHDVTVLINELPSPEFITLDDEENVRIVHQKYENLGHLKSEIDNEMSTKLKLVKDALGKLIVQKTTNNINSQSTILSKNIYEANIVKSQPVFKQSMSKFYNFNNKFIDFTTFFTLYRTYRNSNISGCYVILLFNSPVLDDNFDNYSNVYIGQSINIFKCVYQHVVGNGCQDISSDVLDGKYMYIKLIPSQIGTLDELEKDLILEYNTYYSNKGYNKTSDDDGKYG